MKTLASALFFLTFLVLAGTAPAHADIVVHPLRQVLDAETQEAHFVVSNPTGRIIDGRVSWIDLAATETAYRRASKSERQRFSAAPWLTLSPARFRLEPGARIEIIIRLKRDATPPAGERRTHLLVETGAARTLLRKASNQGLQADISAGVSTPVLLRGAGDAKAKLADTRLVRDSDGLLLLETSIEPSGPFSSYGRLVALFRASGVKSDAVVLSVRENVAGYLEAERRKFDLPLGRHSLGRGELILRYEGADEFEGRIFDERRFEIAPPD